MYVNTVSSQLTSLLMEACVSNDVFDHDNSLHKKLVPYLWPIQKNYTMGKNDLIVNKSIKAMKLANNSLINIHHKLNLRIHHAREIEKTN